MNFSKSSSLRSCISLDTLTILPNQPLVPLCCSLIGLIFASIVCRKESCWITLVDDTEKKCFSFLTRRERGWCLNMQQSQNQIQGFPLEKKTVNLRLGFSSFGCMVAVTPLQVYAYIHTKLVHWFIKKENRLFLGTRKGQKVDSPLELA